VTDSWTNYVSTYLPYYSTAAIDPVRRLLVMVGDASQSPGILVWDLNNPNNPPISPTTQGDSTLQQAQAPGFVFDPVNNVFVGWSGGTAVYTLNPTNWTWTKINPAASNTVTPTAAEGTGTYGRFRYIPSKNAFIAVNRTTEDVYIYKLPTIGSQPTEPAPTITLTANPTSVSSGGSSTLSWTTTNATSVTASGAWSGTKATSGNQGTGALTGTSTFTLTATGPGGTVSTSVTVTVNSAAVLRVGPTRTYRKPSEAAAVAVDGNVIEIDAGVYQDDVVVWRRNNITLRGVGGLAHMQSTQVIPFGSGDSQNGKGIWVIRGSNVTVENIEFSGARVPDGNGAGIRAEGTNLTVRGSYFHDNENGILGGLGMVLIEFSEFANNGFGDGQTHNLYIDSTAVTKLVFQFNYSHHAKIGHNLKSRAAENHILYNRIMDEATGTASYEIDLPNGGLSYVIGNLLQKGVNADNSTLVNYGSEGLPSGRTHSLYVINNTMVNDLGSGTFIRVAAGATSQVVNNIFAGGGTQLGGPGTLATNLVSNNPGLVNQGAYDYRLLSTSAAINAGSDPGTAGTFNLRPMFQYVHKVGSQPRPVNGGFDIGAYEF
jgi:hypothetical protein